MKSKWIRPMMIHGYKIETLCVIVLWNQWAKDLTVRYMVEIWKLPGGLQRQVIKHWNHSKSIDVFPTEESWPQHSKTHFSGELEKKPWKQFYKLKNPNEFELVLTYPWYWGLLKTPMKIINDFPVPSSLQFQGLTFTWLKNVEGSFHYLFPFCSGSFKQFNLVHLQSLRHSELSECDNSGVFWDRLRESGNVWLPHFIPTVNIGSLGSFRYSWFTNAYDTFPWLMFVYIQLTKCSTISRRPKGGVFPLHVREST